MNENSAMPNAKPVVNENDAWIRSMPAKDASNLLVIRAYGKLTA